MHSQIQPQRDGSVNPHAIYHVRAIYNPTNNAMPIKFRTQNPNTIATTIFAKQPSQNPSTNAPFWRRYTFLSHLKTKSQISVRWIKKLVAATDNLQNLYSDIAYTRVFIHISCVGTQPDATNNVITYNNNSFTVIYSNLKIFSSCITFTIYKFIHHCTSPKT